MANEIQISAVTGLLISLQLYEGASTVGSAFAATEIGSTGEYIADMPAGVPYGRYMVLATVGSDVKIASGEIFWDGNYEFLESLTLVQGLNPATPATTTQSSLNAGDISIAITGDGVNSTTFTRT